MFSLYMVCLWFAGIIPPEANPPAPLARPSTVTVRVPVFPGGQLVIVTDRNKMRALPDAKRVVIPPPRPQPPAVAHE